MDLKTKYVFLGRFAPLHHGHQMVIDEMVSRFGIKNCLIIIGSTNVQDERTPFKYSLRKKFIKTLYPKLETLGIKDVGDDNLWLKNLKVIEKKSKSEFIFVGGSKKDLLVLNKAFKTKVLLDRFNEGKDISGTKVRKDLKNIDPRVKKIMSLTSVL